MPLSTAVKKQILARSEEYFELKRQKKEEESDKKAAIILSIDRDVHELFGRVVESDQVEDIAMLTQGLNKFYEGRNCLKTAINFTPVEEKTK
jgi:hypothetical protein